jgi:hypothetical protein
MSTRWRLVVLVGAAAVLMVWWVLVEPPHIWLGSDPYARLEVGMSRRQVEAELGPPGDYRSGATVVGPGTSNKLVNYDPRSVAVISEWLNDRWVFVVAFDGDGRVVRMFLRDNTWEKQGRFENLLWRTKRLWREWFP